MELKRADVGLLVLFLFAEAFLELTFLLEAVLLGHLTFLVLALDDAALCTEARQLSLEHLVLAELALQTAVVQWYLDAGLQAYLVEALLAIAQYPGIIALELMLQSLANHLVGS